MVVPVSSYNPPTLPFPPPSSFLFESLRSEDLNRSLWRTVGVSVLRKFYGFHCLRLQELQKMVQNAEFVDVMQEGVGITTTQTEYKV